MIPIISSEANYLDELITQMDGLELCLYVAISCCPLLGVTCKKEKKDDYDFAISMNYAVASFLRWSTFVCNPETDITTPITIAFFCR